MTVNQSEEGACHGKHRYPNGAAAWSVARRAKVGRAHAYRCDYCRKWHVGGNARRIRKERPVTHPSLDRHATRIGGRRKQIAKASAWVVRAHENCRTEAEKAAVLDVFVKRLSEIEKHGPSDR